MFVQKIYILLFVPATHVYVVPYDDDASALNQNWENLIVQLNKSSRIKYKYIHGVSEKKTFFKKLFYFSVKNTRILSFVQCTLVSKWL